MPYQQLPSNLKRKESLPLKPKLQNHSEYLEELQYHVLWPMACPHLQTSRPIAREKISIINIKMKRKLLLFHPGKVEWATASKYLYKQLKEKANNKASHLVVLELPKAAQAAWHPLCSVCMSILARAESRPDLFQTLPCKPHQNDPLLLWTRFRVRWTTWLLMKALASEKGAVPLTRWTWKTVNDVNKLVEAFISTHS